MNKRLYFIIVTVLFLLLAGQIVAQPESGFPIGSGVRVDALSGSTESYATFYCQIGVDKGMVKPSAVSPAVSINCDEAELQIWQLMSVAVEGRPVVCFESVNLTTLEGCQYADELD